MDILEAEGGRFRVLVGDVLERLRGMPDESVHCVVTSPPYHQLRDYGVSGQLGNEPTLTEYVANQVRVFREIRRVLRPDGTLWLNLGSSYAAAGAASSRRGAPSCGTGDTEPPGSTGPGSSCSGPDDERPDGSPIRHDRNAGSTRPSPEGALLPEPRDHDSGHRGSEKGTADDALLGVPESTTVEETRSAPGAFSPGARDEEVRSLPGTSPPGVPPSERMSDGTSDIPGRPETSAARKTGKEPSRTACGLPFCNGCGICWAYCSIESLGVKAKDLVSVPHLVALALQADGWYLRSDIIWAKPNPMPESIRDRPTKSHEYVFLLTKSERYFFDQDAVREAPRTPGLVQGSPGGSWKSRKDRDGATMDLDRTGRFCGVGGRNIRSVWTIATQSFRGAHFATFPEKLVEPCLLAGTSAEGCCRSCGSPRRRIIERTRSFESGSGRSGNAPSGKNGPDLQGGGETGDVRRGPVVTTKTTGWKAGCECDTGDPVPCVVLDPFMGSGTVGVVALRHGRHAVGIELNPAYAAMSIERVTTSIKKDAEKAEKERLKRERAAKRAKAHPTVVAIADCPRLAAALKMDSNPWKQGELFPEPEA